MQQSCKSVCKKVARPPGADLDVYLAGARVGDCYEELGAGQGRSEPVVFSRFLFFFLHEFNVIVRHVKARVFTDEKNNREYYR